MSVPLAEAICQHMQTIVMKRFFESTSCAGSLLHPAGIGIRNDGLTRPLSLVPCPFFHSSIPESFSK